MGIRLNLAGEVEPSLFTQLETDHVGIAEVPDWVDLLLS